MSWQLEACQWEHCPQETALHHPDIQVDLFWRDIVASLEGWRLLIICISESRFPISRIRKREKTHVTPIADGHGWRWTTWMMLKMALLSILLPSSTSRNSRYLIQHFTTNFISSDLEEGAIEMNTKLGSNQGGKARMKGCLEIRFVVGIDGSFLRK